MADLFFNVQEEYLSQEALNVVKKIKNRYKEVRLRQYINWCIIKNIDIKISSEIIINYLNILKNKEILFKSLIDELAYNLETIVNKNNITYKDQNKAYGIMNDIVFILEESYNNNQTGKNNMSFKYMFKKIMDWIKDKLKFK